MKKLNILFVMCDQLTAMALRVYGNRVCRTLCLLKIRSAAEILDFLPLVVDCGSRVRRILTDCRR
jgi:hypothetical protein